MERTRAVIVLRGDTDSVTTRPVLSYDVLTRMIALPAGDVVIDLAEVEFIDISTLGSLAVGRRLLEYHGRKLTLRSPSRNTARQLHLFGLTHLIEPRDGTRP